MKTTILIKIQGLAVALAFSITAMAQAQSEQGYSLDTLQTLARNRYHLTRQALYQSQMGAESVRNVRTTWLPNVKITGVASYQSEVTALNLPENIPIKMEEGNQDQYKIGAEVTQQIFDGGVSQISSKIEKLNSTAESEKIAGEILKAESQVNELFEAVLVNHEILNILRFIENDLQTREENLVQAVANGLVLNSVLLELRAEIAGLQQKQIENIAQKKVLLSRLSMLTLEKFDTSTVFTYRNPPLHQYPAGFSGRPEYRQYSAQMEAADWRISQMNIANLPRLVAFGMVYYGRPGYNMMDFNTREFWMAGVGLNWNIGGLYTTVHQKKMVRINKQMIENQRDMLENNLMSQDEQFKTDFIRLQELIANDAGIVAMRSEVAKTASVQFETGALTLTDYMQKINAEGQAMVNQRIHEIQHDLLYIKYNTFKNIH